MGKKIKIAYIYYSEFPVHIAHAKSINCDMYYYNRLRLPNISVFVPIQELFNSLFIPKYDVYFCESTGGLLGAILKKKLYGSKIIYYAVDHLFYRLQNISNYKKQYYKFLLKSVDGVISDSDLMAEDVKKFMNCPIETCYPFVEDRFFKYNADLNSHNITFIGRVDEWKGVDVLINAFKLVKRQIKDVKLFILGEGPLKDKINCEGINFVGWQNNPEYFLAKSRLYVHPARHEPFGVSILEAMAVGTIPIISKNMGCRIAVSEVSDNLFVEIDSMNVAKKIVELMSMNYKEIQKLSSKCKEIAAKFKRDKSIDNFKVKFYELLEKIE